jgi:hypothetical protein
VNKGLILLSGVVLLGVLCASGAASQESSAGLLSGVSRNSPGILGGHEFVFSSFLQDPFVRTSLRTGLGFGMTPELVVPLVTMNDTSYFGLKGSLLYALLDVEYQQRIRDWLALRGRVRVIGRMADETPALISQGITLFSIFELGWLIRIEESERLLLSGSLGIVNSSMTDVYLQRFIEGIIENGRITPANRLVQTTPTLRGVAGLHGAYAISDLVGLTFSGDLDYGESADRFSAAEWSYGLGAAVDFNLLRSTGTPAGFIIGVETHSLAMGQREGSESTVTFFGRVGYTGSKEFSIGLDLGYELTHVRGIEDRQGFLSALVDTRLYF